MYSQSQSRTVLQSRQSRSGMVAAEAAEERPVSLTVNGALWLTCLCMPADLDALAVGFLFNEGLIEAPADVALVRVCPSGENVDVWLGRAVPRPPAWRRTAGCIGGRTAVTTEHDRPVLMDAPVLPAGAIGQLMCALFAGQRL